MQQPRPDRLPNILATVTTVLFYFVLAGAALVLLATPILKAAGAENQWYWGLPVSAVATDTETRVATRWEGTVLRVEDMRGSLRLPLDALPWWLFTLLWLHVAVMAGLVLAFLHHLRQLFRRVRDGTPFDAANAVRLRWLGLLLLALATLNTVAGAAVSLAVRGAVADGNFRVPASLKVDMTMVFVAFVLLALAAIFRRGAELEDERALVI
jgi:hypothetical protein